MNAAEPQPDPADEEYTLPSVEALLAGTLALMTGYAQSARDCAHRPIMARKLVSNLACLCAHPQLSSAMQTMLANLRTRWELEMEHEAGVASTERRPTPLWHPIPARVQ